MGKRFTLAPRSNNALLNVMDIMLHETRGLPGSFVFLDISFNMKALTSTYKFTVFVSLLGVNNDLRNLAYEGTSLIASRKGMLI